MYGLGEVQLEAGLLAPPQVLLHAVARQRDAAQVVAVPEGVHELRAGTVGQANVADHQIKRALLLLRDLEGVGDGDGDEDVEAELLAEEAGHDHEGALVVLDEQHLERLGQRRYHPREPRRRRRRQWR